MRIGSNGDIGGRQERGGVGCCKRGENFYCREEVAVVSFVAEKGQKRKGRILLLGEESSHLIVFCFAAAITVGVAAAVNCNL